MSVAVAFASPTMAAQQTDLDQLYKDGVAARLAGKSAIAVDELQTVVNARPHDVDARLNLALAQMGLHLYDDADANLLQVLDQAPNYADARVARARIAWYRGNLAAADAQLAPLVAQGNADAMALSAQVAAARLGAALLPWRLDVTGSLSSLTNEQPAWREATVSLGRRLDERTSATVTVDDAEQFSQTNVYLQARVDLRLGSGSAYVGVGGTPDATFRPDVAVLGGFNAAISHSVGVTAFTLDASWARYPVGDVRAIDPGIEETLGRLTLSAKWVNVIDENNMYSAGIIVGGVVSVTPKIQLRAGYSDAPDTELGVTERVKAVTAGGEYDLGRRVSLRLDVGHELYTAYDRNYVAIGTVWRF